MWKRLTALWFLVRTDAKRLWYALRHPQAPGWLKAGTVLVLLYVLSPVDLIPDMIPIVGLLDDLIVVPTVVRWMLGRLPPQIREYAQERAAGRVASAGSSDDQASK